MMGAEPAPLISFVLPFKQHRIFIIPMLISLTNDGEKSAKDINITMRLPDIIYARSVQRTADKITARRVERVYDQGENKYITIINYRLTDLPPHETTNVKDPIFSKEPSSITEPVRTRTKDGVPVTAMIRVDYSFDVRVIVEAEDIPPLKMSSHIAFINGNATDLRQIATRRFKDLSESSRTEVESPMLFIGFRDFKRRTYKSTELMEVDLNSMSQAVLTMRRR
jgi:hypothetical protein